MLIDTLINRLVVITLLQMMVTIGLSGSSAESLAVLREPKVLLGATAVKPTGGSNECLRRSTESAHA